MTFDLNKVHQAAIDIARMAGDLSLTYFGKDIDIERKKDTSPVTIADRETEQLMRREIKARFPKHGIIGEEFGRYQANSPVQWILDPIDGTKSFIHGVPFYTTLIGIMRKGKPVSGIIYAPALEDLCEATVGMGARLNGTRCSVGRGTSLEEATFLTTDVTTAGEVGLEEAMHRMIKKSQLHRTWGDAYGHMMVATGRADVMFDPVLNIWDAAPLLPIVQEAGGVFCDITGKETIQSGNGISCNKMLIKEVLEVF